MTTEDTRVVITGMGHVSSVGHSLDEAFAAMLQGRSGVRRSETMVERGMRCHSMGEIVDLDTSGINRRAVRGLSRGGSFVWVALQEALAQAQLQDEQLQSERAGSVMGDSGSSVADTVIGVMEKMAQQGGRGLRGVSPFSILRAMTNSTSANITTQLQMRGVSHSVSSACASTLHATGICYDLIRQGRQDLMITGGADEAYWVMLAMFDATSALSTSFNDRVETASRPYDRDRDGFVPAEGGGILILESLSHALARGAPIQAEIVGYAATSDGYDLVKPSGEGSLACMRAALAGADDVPTDVVSAHATSTPAGDIAELQSIQQLFVNKMPQVCAFKGQLGHTVGGSGVAESTLAIRMMQEGKLIPLCKYRNPGSAGGGNAAGAGAQRPGDQPGDEKQLWFWRHQRLCDLSQVPAVIAFADRTSVEQVEEGTELAPKFDADGLLPVVTTDYLSGDVLMLGYMNAEALRCTLETGEAHYYSRSRQRLWRKGETSGLVQRVCEVRIDDDQDAVWLRVDIEGDASCHVGYRSCFYRDVQVDDGGHVTLVFTESEKRFDPDRVYADQPNPTRL